MKAKVYSLEGKELKELELPKFFENTYRPDLIKRAVLSIQSKGYQKKGNSPYANRENTAEYRGVRKANGMDVNINTGHARLPRLKNRRVIMAGRVAGVSQAVGGPRAHPPKTSKNLVKKINSKEKTKAILSALSATANKALVDMRGHKFPENLEFPLVVDNSLEKLNKTNKVYDFLESIGLNQDVSRAKDSKSFRAGKGKMRSRKYKKRKSVLFVLGDNSNYKSFKNLEGVDVVSANDVTVTDLAPGTHAARLTVFSEDAIKKLTSRFE